MKTLILTTTLLAALAGDRLVAVEPMGTGFTYQGQLNDGGAPANGNYDMIFNLYDDPTNGNVLGNFSIFGAVPVTNGRFTVELNSYGEFGTNAFYGEARWLQIGMRTNNNNALNPWINLSPRQPINCAPQAMFAQNASSADTAGVAATVPDGAITGSKLANGAVQANNLAPGTLDWANITGIPAGFADGVDNDATYTAGAGLSLSPANEFSVNFGSSGVANTASRSDHQHFGAKWTGSASWGIGLGVTNTSGTFAAGVYGQQGDGSGFPYFFGSVAAGVWGESSQGSGVYGASGYANGNGVFGYAAKTNGASAGVAGQSVSTSGAGVRGLATATTGETIGVRGEAASGEGTGVMGLASALWGNSTGVYGESSAVHGTGVFGKATFVSGVGANYGVVGQSDSLWGYGVYGHAASPSGINFGVVGESESPGGYGVVARNTNGVGLKVEGTGVIQSDADSYIWIPGAVGYSWPTASSVDRSEEYLTVSGLNTWVLFPLTLPGISYGQTTMLKSIEVFYHENDPDNGFISKTRIWESGSQGTNFSLEDNVPRKSNIKSSYTLPVNRYLGGTAGFFTVGIKYDFTITLEEHHLYIYGLKVRLGHK